MKASKVAQLKVSVPAGPGALGAKSFGLFENGITVAELPDEACWTGGDCGATWF